MLNPSVRRRMALSAALVVSWRPTGANLSGLLRSIITSFIALGVSLYVLPGRQSSGPLAVVVLALVVAAVGVVLRPLLLGFALLLGSFGLLLVGVLAQVVILTVAVGVAPDVHVSSFSVIVGAAWIAATVAALVNWLLDAGTQDAYLAQVLGRVVRQAHRHAGDADAAVGEPGMVIVQLDGVGQALLHQAIVAGAVPTIAHWLRSGSHRDYRWHTGLPATTPAGQAMLLHGDNRTVPSFRWFEKDTGRMVVANHAGDAHLIEQRMSTGRGLLADGGVSVSNVFSGDAPTRILTMSDARLPSRSTGGLASFATTSVGFVRTAVVFVGQVIQEKFQARRQRRRDVRPRVARGTVFALLRGVTTGLLHDLDVAIVAEQMALGAPVIFVDFVDYDEIAHHAGPSRPESMRALDGLDRVLEFFDAVAAEVNRRYEIVVVSDHGQAQGEPFGQLTGQSLQEVVDSLVTERVDVATPHGTGNLHAPDDDAPAEQWGSANLLLTSAARARTRGVGRIARNRADRLGSGDDELTVALGRRPGATTGEREAIPLVVSAGSLAHIYLPDVPGRASREDIDALYPGLVDGLAAHPGIGLVMVRGANGLLAIGAAGWRRIAAHGLAGTCGAARPGGPEGDGLDPTETYGTRAVADLLDLDARDHVGDLVVLGRLDRNTGEVAAFEDLVGSHGGLGGDQTEAVLLVPSSWPVLSRGDSLDAHGSGGRPTLTGLDVHRALVDRLCGLGLRADARPQPSPVVAEPADLSPRTSPA